MLQEGGEAEDAVVAAVRTMVWFHIVPNNDHSFLTTSVDHRAFVLISKGIKR